jgi:hypothetical protein
VSALQRHGPCLWKKSNNVHSSAVIIQTIVTTLLLRTAMQ